MSEDKPEQPTPVLAQQELNKFLTELLARKAREGVKDVYANQANFEIGDLDVKILFGQVSQLSGKPAIDWHTAVTMAWAEAKLLSLYLRVNIAIHEATHGAIKIPAGLLPPSIPAPEDIATNPVSKKLFDTIQAIRSELMDEQLALMEKSAGD